MPRSNNVLVGALAGTGKTTSMKETFLRGAGVKSGLRGTEEQEAIWKHTNCKNSRHKGMLAFNNSIKEEWKAFQIPGLEVNSTFGFGLKVLKMNNVQCTFDADKTEKLLEAMNPRLTNKQVWPIKRLVELARLTLTDNDYEQLSYLAADNCIQINEEGIDYAQDLIEKHEEVTEIIDHADMVWLPAVMGKRIRPFDFLGVDECQDLNRAQQHLIMHHANRLLMVGDERQAIYQFAGADGNSYGAMREWMASRTIGIIELPLTISRRCSKAATRLAQEIVPQFKCLPTALEGSATECTPMEWFGRTLPSLTPDHMVIARKNAPIVQATLSLLKRRKPAKMLGRDFGNDVEYYIKSFARGTDKTDVIKRRIEEDMEEQKIKWSKMKYVSEKAKEKYFDVSTSAIVFCEMGTTVEEVYKTISDIFVDVKDNPKNVIRLASIHRSKGLEARHIHFLEHDVTGVRRIINKREVEPAPEEVNLRYIGITRTQEHLTMVKAAQETP